VPSWFQIFPVFRAELDGKLGEVRLFFMRKTLKTTADIRLDIEERFVDLNGRFVPAGFAAGAVIYQLKQPASILGALCRAPADLQSVSLSDAVLHQPSAPYSNQEAITFLAAAGKDRLDELHKWLGKLVGRGATFWFSHFDESEKVGFVERARMGEYRERLDDFEKESIKGMQCHLGLLTERGDWLLLHSLLPAVEFQISIHGSDRLCRDLSRLICATPVSDCES
jgi:hypothetical protein